VGYVDFLGKGKNPRGGESYNYVTHWGAGTYTLAGPSSQPTIVMTNSYDGMVFKMTFSDGLLTAASSDGGFKLKLLQRRYVDSPVLSKPELNPQSHKFLLQSLWHLDCAGWRGYIDFFSKKEYRTHWNFGDKLLTCSFRNEGGCFTPSRYSVSLSDSGNMVINMVNKYDPFTFALHVNDAQNELYGKRSDGMVCKAKLIAKGYTVQ
jgi:hypothetical protein